MISQASLLAKFSSSMNFPGLAPLAGHPGKLSSRKSGLRRMRKSWVASVPPIQYTLFIGIAQYRYETSLAWGVSRPGGLASDGGHSRQTLLTWLSSAHDCVLRRRDHDSRAAPNVKSGTIFHYERCTQDEHIACLPSRLLLEGCTERLDSHSPASFLHCWDHAHKLGRRPRMTSPSATAPSLACWALGLGAPRRALEGRRAWLWRPARLGMAVPRDGRRRLPRGRKVRLVHVQPWARKSDSVGRSVSAVFRGLLSVTSSRLTGC